MSCPSTHQRQIFSTVVDKCLELSSDVFSLSRLTDKKLESCALLLLRLYSEYRVFVFLLVLYYQYRVFCFFYCGILRNVFFSFTAVFWVSFFFVSFTAVLCSYLFWFALTVFVFNNNKLIMIILLSTLEHPQTKSIFFSPRVTPVVGGNLCSATRCGCWALGGYSKDSRHNILHVMRRETLLEARGSCANIQGATTPLSLSTFRKVWKWTFISKLASY